MFVEKEAVDLPDETAAAQMTATKTQAVVVVVVVGHTMLRSIRCRAVIANVDVPLLAEAPSPTDVPARPTTVHRANAVHDRFAHPDLSPAFPRTTTSRLVARRFPGARSVPSIN